MTIAATPKHGKNIQIAIAGEAFVVAELCKLGWIAVPTAKNTPGVDILASRPPPSNTQVRIDVKTRAGKNQGSWLIGGVHMSGPHDFIVLVDLGNKDETPWYWIIPARVARSLAISRGGLTQIRTDDVVEFRNRWELLNG